MSRIGKQPVKVPAGVKISCTNRVIQAEGPKGKLSFTHHPNVKVTVAGDQVTVERSSDVKLDRALHGTTRAVVRNMVVGVSEGFAKRLRIVGVGWAGRLEGNKVVLQIGFCHPVELVIPAGMKAEMANPQQLTLTGPDKQVVGQFAAEVRKVRPPEPYNQKGIRYEDEVVRKKAGKSFASTTA